MNLTLCRAIYNINDPSGVSRPARRTLPKDFVFMDRVTKMIRWVPIIGFPGYKISSNGLVKDIKKNLLVNFRVYKTHKGRFTVNIQPRKNSHPCRLYVHLLVWDHFGDSKRVDGDHIHHKDLNYTNNDISNLQRLTAADHRALHYSIKHG